MSRNRRNKRSLAVITGASTGIGYELARCCAQNGFDLVIVADEAEIQDAAEDFRTLGAEVTAIEADLATIEGVEKLYAAIEGRQVDALLANAGVGLGRSFLDQDFNDVIRVIDTNITGTLYLIQKIARDMHDRKAGKVLITGSIAGFTPGAFQALSRHEGLHRLVLVCPTGRAEGFGHYCYLPHARRDRD
jgi:short-subunit dehydrogenase